MTYNKINICSWCTNFNGTTDLLFTIIDDDFGTYVPEKFIKFCPFCGRELKTDDRQ